MSKANDQVKMQTPAKKPSSAVVKDKVRLYINSAQEETHAYR